MISVLGSNCRLPGCGTGEKVRKRARVWELGLSGVSVGRAAGVRVWLHQIMITVCFFLLASFHFCSSLRDDELGKFRVCRATSAEEIGLIGTVIGVEASAMQRRR